MGDRRQDNCPFSSRLVIFISTSMPIITFYIPPPYQLGGFLSNSKGEKNLSCFSHQKQIEPIL
jgi:hypothetical protein